MLIMKKITTFLMESFRTAVTLVWFVVGMGLAMGDEGRHTIEGFLAHLVGEERSMRGFRSADVLDLRI